MLRKAFVMQLLPNQEAEYEKRHNPIWPELESLLKEQGVVDYSIFLHTETLQLFAYAVVESDERWERIADSPICKKWWEHMSPLMDTNPDGSPMAVELKEVFHIDALS
ncbi:L-rhamnose mutarotase [Puniceicoccaceae bacterium K14]|nr:L-rhamnose mutarotase [Puniceicoccaceae bacterium K14]